MMEVCLHVPLNYSCHCSVDVLLYYCFSFGTNMWPILFLVSGISASRRLSDLTAPFISREGIRSLFFSDAIFF
jgi:hypothetical protein